MASRVKRWSVSAVDLWDGLRDASAATDDREIDVIFAADHDAVVDELVEALEEAQALIFARVDSADTWRKRVIRENNAMIEKYRSDA